MDRTEESYENENPGPPISTTHKVLAWGVHLITAGGAVLALASIIAIMERQWVLVFVLMAASLLVDSIDGTLARLVKVKKALPRFDGALLDNIVDYISYVFVPAFFLYGADLLPVGLAIPAASLVVLVSSYQFCQADAKTEDHYFKGFPSYWNIVVFYLFLLELNPWINLAVIVGLCAMVFIPIKYIYPSRAPKYQHLTLTLAAMWAALCAAILTQIPNHNMYLVWASLLFAVYYVGISLHLMFSPPSAQRGEKRRRIDIRRLAKDRWRRKDERRRTRGEYRDF
jgi:phosphatidylcholine synthase